MRSFFMYQTEEKAEDHLESWRNASLESGSSGDRPKKLQTQGGGSDALAEEGLK